MELAVVAIVLFKGLLPFATIICNTGSGSSLSEEYGTIEVQLQFTTQKKQDDNDETKTKKKRRRRRNIRKCGW